MPLNSSTSDFPKFLGVCMETFITLIDDSDIDVKMVADECLNRVIRVRTFVECCPSALLLRA